jgi:hypothetical protein
MAQVTRKRRTSPDIEYHLDYQFSSWNGIPEYAEWWPEMDSIEREVFHLEWVGITEARLDQLQQWAERGLLTTRQRARYAELLKLVAEQRPTLERLLES